MDEWYARDLPLPARRPIRVLVACGEHDVVIPPANAALLADRWPEARVERFADGGHAFMAQHPARTANVIESFLHR